MQGLQAKAASGALLSEVIRVPVDSLPGSLCAVLGACLDADPARRPTAAHLLQHLSHVRAALPPPGGSS